MMTPKVHRSKNRTVIKTYRTIPYDEFATVLKEDGEAFLENPEGEPLRRQTVWRAAKRLTELVGKKVYYDRALLCLNRKTHLEGYSFWTEDRQPPSQTSSAS